MLGGTVKVCVAGGIVSDPSKEKVQGIDIEGGVVCLGPARES